MIKTHKDPNTLHGSLMRCSKLHKKVLGQRFKEVELSEGKPKLLDLLVRNPGCSQRELASSCRLEPATVTSILSGMEKEELIYRERNPKDKRILNVFLTKKGIDSQRKVDSIFSSVDDICFNGFTKEEKTIAISILNKIGDNLSKEFKKNLDIEK